MIREFTKSRDSGCNRKSCHSPKRLENFDDVWMIQLQKHLQFLDNLDIHWSGEDWALLGNDHIKHCRKAKYRKVIWCLCFHSASAILNQYYQYLSIILINIL